MTGPAWESLTPEQQRAEWDRFNQWRQYQTPGTGRHAAGPTAGAPGFPPPLPPYPAVAVAQQPPREEKTNVAAGIGLATGIIGLFVVPFLFGIIALVCGAAGLEHAKRYNGTGHGGSVGALILGGLNLAIGIIVAAIATS